jgi:alpha-tubulin suppressor-like RCC1 family protein
VPEVCNAIDDDCDGRTDEDLLVMLYTDGDRDGFGAGTPMTGCPGLMGTVTNGDDCDDARASSNPAAMEACDGTADDDCDGTVDEDCGCVAGTTRVCGSDTGACVAGTQTCIDGLWAGCSGTGPTTESCNGLDDDCDGETDEGLLANGCYRDNDADGYGTGAATQQCLDLTRDMLGFCPAGYTNVASPADCNDSVAEIRPGAGERCDGIDNDCDGTADEELLVMQYTDADRDGYGAGTPVTACPGLPGRVTNGDDCDDTRAGVNPAVAEVCNAVDDDCNGVVDDGLQVMLFTDADRDGFGAGTPVTGCPGMTGTVTNGDDCDDTVSARNPGNPEVCDRVPDNDCDLATNPFDEDGDGFDRASCGGSDCDDADSTVYPGASQLCDRKDNTCALGGGVLATEDFDRDGFAPLGASCSGGPFPALDCNDASAVVSPLALEICNAVDDNCDGQRDEQPAVTADCNRPGSIGACVSGACTLAGCTGSYLNCDGLAFNGCEADTRTSTAHCGGCDGRCASGGVCTLGACGCPSGQVVCGAAPGLCANLQTSTAHCGACDNACPAGASCEDGTCRCPFGQILCGGVCVDPMVNIAHCGGCGQTCTGGSCTGGACACPGAEGTLCAGVCHDLAVDLNHCGVCGAGCRGGSCAGGACTCPATRPTVCDGTCTNTITDATNCGGCGVSCGLAGTCSARACDVVSSTSGVSQRSIALRTGGGMAAFGYYATEPPPWPTGVVPTEVAVGDLHLCARAGGEVRCTGPEPYGPVRGDGAATGSFDSWTAPVVTDAVAITSGSSHTCALRAGGSVSCWGSNLFDQIGDGTSIDRAIPTLVPGLVDVVEVRAGGSSTCARTSTGAVACWGNNQFAQCGTGTSGGTVANPTTLALGGAATQLFVGTLAACARVGTDVRCWGLGSSGQLGAIPSALLMSPTIDAALALADEVVFGDSHCCARFGATVRCRGDDGSGQLGDGASITSSSTITSTGLADIVSIQAGSRHTCAETSAGSLRCWGAGESLGTSIARRVPTALAGLP